MNPAKADRWVDEGDEGTEAGAQCGAAAASHSA